ncbi:hypothetical protein [Microcystis sp. LEGE 08355]|jgi:hypothetical protein|uniref:slr1957 family protein n=1 Tax=Microcystis sp. LEGE 08355 TaxID=1828687 RepID=UPI00187F8F8C|nr:hypothetical protein [Microcystis sp. LEGE 08355]MBE9073159.1 hypothetical protein [Microcystis sp. LEGE 08355]
MKHFHEPWIQEWCQENGWTELFLERYSNYWAFPPNAVMPEPIPTKVLQKIKRQKGLSPAEKLWLGVAIGLTVTALILCVIFACPMPIVLAFAFDAVTAARLEVEY